MSTNIRTTICNNIIQCIKQKSHSPELFHRIQTTLQVKHTAGHPEIHLPLTNFDEIKSDNNFPTTVINQKYFNGILDVSMRTTKSKSNSLVFRIDSDTFTKETLSLKPAALKTNYPEKILIEFSSPNIAKPFHMGHLRSTIIGNFISNLYDFLGHNVVRINYLGDWGTQFGYLKLGMDLVGHSNESFKQNPIKYLFDAYVNVHKLSETDPKIHSQAKEIFNRLEQNDDDDMTTWNLYRNVTVQELTKMYQRLGVRFDEYSWESNYRKSRIGQCLKEMERFNLLSEDADGKKVICMDETKSVSILKSDGTSLYLTRDIAALLDRVQRHQFDRMLYVVENGQYYHFNSLIKIGERLNVPNIDHVQHVKFGRIHGMSTRRGTVVFLSDILNEAQDIMKSKQLESPTTKDGSNIDTIQNILGVSAVIVNDLKQRRTRDYDFDWTKVLQVNGDTGIKLQYTHCRLHNLAEVNCNITAAEQVNPTLLSEPEALNLIVEIARFPEIIYKCEEHLEAFTLVSYLFSLSATINRALKVLNVKNHSNHDVQQQRMLLFLTAKMVLKNGMEILGLQPLNKM